MKAVLISIQPYWVFLIIAKIMGWNIGNEKTVEVRKSYPKAENWNKVAKIYCSKDKRSFSKIPKEYQPFMERFLGKVIGEFVCDRVYKYASDLFRSAPVKGTDILTEDMVKLSCLTAKELYEYEHSTEPKENCICLVGLYGWHISDLKIYDEPKKLRDLFTIDRHAVKQCGHRERACNNPDLTNGAFLPGSYVCMKGEIDWCSACKRKPVTRAPQSWCYVEELNEK